MVQDTCQLKLNTPVATGTSGEKVHQLNLSLFIVLSPALLGACMAAIEQGEVLETDLREVLASGIKSLAVVLLHSYTSIHIHIMRL